MPDLFKLEELHSKFGKWISRQLLNLKFPRLERELIAVLTDKELYSIEIEEAISELRGRNKHFGSIQPAVRDLEKQGLLSARWGDEDVELPGWPRRRYYTATSRGKQMLRDFREKEAELQ